MAVVAECCFIFASVEMKVAQVRTEHRTRPVQTLQGKQEASAYTDRVCGRAGRSLSLGLWTVRL